MSAKYSKNKCHVCFQNIGCRGVCAHFRRDPSFSHVRQIFVIFSTPFVCAGFFLFSAVFLPDFLPDFPVLISLYQSRKLYLGAFDKSLTHKMYRWFRASCPELLLPLFSSRAAFTSILESVRSVPFPMPRAFFRTGGGPRVALSILPPPPAALTQDLAETASNAWATGQAPLAERDRAASPAPPSNDGEHDHGSGGGGGDTSLKRARRDGGASARYYGPSCGLRADIAAGGRWRRPPLPLMARVPGAGASVAGTGEKQRAATYSVTPLYFPAAETWWAQLAREEALVGGGGGGGNGWRSHARAQTSISGVWLLQGSVCRGKGAGGALPPVSEVGTRAVALEPEEESGGGIAPLAKWPLRVPYNA